MIHACMAVTGFHPSGKTLKVFALYLLKVLEKVATHNIKSQSHSRYLVRSYIYSCSYVVYNQ